MVDTARKGARPLPWWFVPTGIGAAVIVAVAVVTFIWLRQRRLTAEKREERQRLDSAAERLRERMELASLVEFNRILLEDYHGVATKQANKSFYSALFAMGVGLLVLVGAFVASMQFNALGERIFIGSLAALATVFVGYLSKTFLVVYDRSLQQLNQYFNQPVLNQYFLSAERIAERLEPEQRNMLLAKIVTDVLDTGKRMHEASTSPPSRARIARPRRAAGQSQTAAAP
ncbi:TRADD-N-associated membrane domain-containing protein [Streptomyces goshikiensis]